MRDGLTVLSLCDGAACAAEAMRQAGIQIGAYHAVELDCRDTEAARAAAERNTPQLRRLCDDMHDFTAAHAAAIGQVDLLVAGFPCPTFSIAGKRAGFDDPRGQLIHQVMRIIKLTNPRAWLLENVVPAAPVLARLNAIIGAEPVIANSTAYGAQNRRRAFWSNRAFSVRTDIHPATIADILQPPDCPEVQAQKLYPFTPLAQPVGRHVRVIGTTRPQSIKRKSGNVPDDCIVQPPDSKAKAITSRPHAALLPVAGAPYDIQQQDRIHDETGKAQCVAAENGKPALIQQQRRVHADDGKAPAVMSGAPDSGTLARLVGGDTISIQDRVNTTSAKAPSITASDGGGTGQRLIDAAHLQARRLTVTECLRLQHLPDDYLAPRTGKTAALRAIGNGFDCAVVADILRQICADDAAPPPCQQELL